MRVRAEHPRQQRRIFITLDSWYWGGFRAGFTCLSRILYTERTSFSSVPANILRACHCPDRSCRDAGSVLTPFVGAVS